jgi:uncharacterized protein GlcG (DUF336 family)
MRQPPLFKPTVSNLNLNMQDYQGMMTGAIPIDGGVPIIEAGKVIGAIGVSGGSGEQDGHIAKAVI